MAATASTMAELGMKAPLFCLPSTSGKIVTLSDFDNSPALLVIFMCNHCPFVKHVIDFLVKLIKEYQEKGVAVIGINSNDAQNFPEDSPETMIKIAKEKQFTFPYLYDKSQEVAKEYHAACTPDFFLFDSKRKLVYRGQLDDSRPGNNVPITGKDLRAAMDALLEGKQMPANQKPSMGCSIKWKAGNEPDYAQ